MTAENRPQASWQTVGNSGIRTACQDVECPHEPVLCFGALRSDPRQWYTCCLCGAELSWEEAYRIEKGHDQ